MNKNILCISAFLCALLSSNAHAGMDSARVDYGHGRYAEAMKEYEIYAARGFGLAHFMIATMYANGQGVERDLDQAIKHAKLAVDKGSPEGMAIIAMIYDSAASPLKDESSAVEWFKKGVEVGDLNSMRILATRYRDGRGVPQDFERARALFERAAKEDDLRSKYELGQIYERGLGVEKDDRVARRWYESMLTEPYRLMEMNYLSLYVPLAVLMERNPTNVRDLSTAAKMLQAAANDGSVDAMYHLGRMLELGRGQPANAEQAAVWYERAADQGDGRALYRGGKLFRDGRGVKQDRGEALNWFLEGAQRGNVNAMRAAGRMLDEGVNGVPDRAEALSMYCKAAMADKTWQGPDKVSDEVLARNFATLQRCIAVAKPLPAAQGLYATLLETLPPSLIAKANSMATADMSISSLAGAEE